MKSTKSLYTLMVLALASGASLACSDPGSDLDAHAAYGEQCSGDEDCTGGLCLSKGHYNLCSAGCNAVACPNGDRCVNTSLGSFCDPHTGTSPAPDGGAPPKPDTGPKPTACSGNSGCNDSQYCKALSKGSGTCTGCAPMGCGQSCTSGGAGTCLDSKRLKFCYKGTTKIVDCSLFGNVCGSKSLGIPQCESASASSKCSLSKCSKSGFSYSCATGSYSTKYSYGGSGPNGLSSFKVTFSNGHTVSCYFSSYSHGTCSDDTGSSCSF